MQFGCKCFKNTVECEILNMKKMGTLMGSNSQFFLQYDTLIFKL